MEEGDTACGAGADAGLVAGSVGIVSRKGPGDAGGGSSCMGLAVVPCGQGASWYQVFPSARHFMTAWASGAKPAAATIHSSFFSIASIHCSVIDFCLEEDALVSNVQELCDACSYKLTCR